VRCPVGPAARPCEQGPSALAISWVEAASSPDAAPIWEATAAGGSGQSKPCTAPPLQRPCGRRRSGLAHRCRRGCASAPVGQQPIPYCPSSRRRRNRHRVGCGVALSAAEQRGRQAERRGRAPRAEGRAAGRCRRAAHLSRAGRSRLGRWERVQRKAARRRFSAGLSGTETNRSGSAGLGASFPRSRGLRTGSRAERRRARRPAPWRTGGRSRAGGEKGGRRRAGVRVAGDREGRAGRRGRRGAR